MFTKRSQGKSFMSKTTTDRRHYNEFWGRKRYIKLFLFQTKRETFLIIKNNYTHF